MSRLGIVLAKICRCGDVLALSGQLGCGKTALARALIRDLIGDAAEVPSPTFTIVQSYGPAVGLGCFVHHFDLFRVSDLEELREIGIEDALADLCLIEWPERLGPLLPADRLEINIAFGSLPGRREVRLAGNPPWGDRLRGVDLV
jgi:tRNA threonylcarbamoyladenosine biosynthesis protein TsaE